MKRVQRNIKTHGATLVLLAIMCLVAVLLGPGYFEDDGDRFLPWFGFLAVVGFLVGTLVSFIPRRAKAETSWAQQAGGAALAASGGLAILALGPAWAGAIAGGICGVGISVALFGPPVSGSRL